VRALPADARTLLLVAAADPTGDPALVAGAAEQLDIDSEAGETAEVQRLVSWQPRVRFRHPLIRSAAYYAAPRGARSRAHAVLAAATDPVADPDRRAWHRAEAAAGPDEEVAAELERSAGRAQARGGLAAAAAFGERAALLTPAPQRRAQRLLAAAGAKRDAGELDAALGLLAAVEAGPPDPRLAAEVEHLRGQIAADQRRDSDAARLLLSAARRLEPLDAGLAREAHLESLVAAMSVGHLAIPAGVPEAAGAARAAPPGPGPPRPADVVLDALALRFTQGHAAAAPALARALELLLALDGGTGEARRWLWLVGGRVSNIIAMELWDFESWHALAARQVEAARDAGALVHLQVALTYLAAAHVAAGELAAATRVIGEGRMIAEAAGNPPARHAAMTLAAWRGQEHEATELIEATAQEATAQGMGRMVDFAACVSAVLHNGLGRYDAARDAARPAFEREPVGYGPLLVPELAEAAARTGDTDLVQAALHWLTERTRVTPTGWALGIQARTRALLSKRRDRRALLPGVDRAPGPDPGPLPAGPRPPALRRVAAPPAPPPRRPGPAAHRLGDVRLDGHDCVRRTGPGRAARHWRAGPPARPRGCGGAHPAGGADRPAGRRAPDQPGDRRPAVPQRQHRRIPPAQDLPQAGRRQPGPARPDDRQQDARAAGLTGRYGLLSTRIRSSTRMTPGADQAAATA
jgi:hypothetical protein